MLKGLTLSYKYLTLFLLLFIFSCSSNSESTEDNSPTLNDDKPCTSDSNDCIEKLIINSEGNHFSFYSNYDFVSKSNKKWAKIKSVIFLIHGVSRTAGPYFSYMNNSISNLNKQDETLIISMHFKDNLSASTNELFWNTSSWREGADSDNQNINISSFKMIDEVINKIKNQGNFPSLKNIVITGHSSGGTYAHLYAISGKSETTSSSYNFQYIIANSQYYCYPDSKRYDSNTNSFYSPSTCNGISNWPYGYSNIINYSKNSSESILKENQIKRRTIYLQGEDDTSTTGTLNTKDCEAILLGENRNKRSLYIQKYFEEYYKSTHNHKRLIVQQVGHNANDIYNSSTFKNHLSSSIYQ